MNATIQTNPSNASHLARAAKSLLALACVATIAGGCAWFGKSEEPTDSTSDATQLTTKPSTTQLSGENISPIAPVLQQASQAVVRGPLPLVYLVESDGTMRVRNVGTNEEIITFDAKAAQIVRVDTRGVFLASQPVIGANLAQGTYALELVSSDIHGVRSKQTRTGVIQSP